MSEENVEIVRHFYERLDEALAAYWATSEQAFDETRGAPEVWEMLHEDVEWRPTFTPDRLRGREGVRRAIDDWLDAADDWRISVQEVKAGSEERALAVITIHMRGKGSGVAVDQRTFMAIRVRDRKIASIEGFADRSEALEAAGLSE